MASGYCFRLRNPLQIPSILHMLLPYLSPSLSFLQDLPASVPTPPLLPWRLIRARPPAPAPHPRAKVPFKFDKSIRPLLLVNKNLPLASVNAQHVTIIKRNPRCPKGRPRCPTAPHLQAMPRFLRCIIGNRDRAEAIDSAAPIGASVTFGRGCGRDDNLRAPVGPEDIAEDCWGWILEVEIS